MVVCFALGWCPGACFYKPFTLYADEKDLGGFTLLVGQAVDLFILTELDIVAHGLGKKS